MQRKQLITQKVKGKRKLSVTFVQAVPFARGNEAFAQLHIQGIAGIAKQV